MTDEKWVLEAPKSKYLGEKSSPNVSSDSENEVIESEFTDSSEVQDNVRSNIRTSVGLFVNDLKTSGDIKHNPLAWLISLIIVAPGVIIGVNGIENGDSFAASFSIDNELIKSIAILLFDFLIIGQLIIGPGACTIFAKNKNLGPTVFVAMGSSAVLMINHEVIVKMAQTNDILAVLTCIGCLAPLVLILRNKRKQLPAGRARHTWAFLMSVSIMMFSSASIVVALQNSSTLEIDDGIAWSSLLVVAGAIGWAWPKGRHLIEDVAEEIIEKAV